MSAFFFQPEDGIRDLYVTGVQTCALPISERKAGRGPLLLAFDLLYESYRQLMDRPLLERRDRLARLVVRGAPILVPEHLESDGEPFLEAVREFGLEGVVAKRRDSTYVPGARAADWLKVHAVGRMDVTV